MLALVSSEAPAQTTPAFNLKSIVSTTEVDSAAKPLETWSPSGILKSAVTTVAIPVQQVVATITGTVMQAQPANKSDGSLAPAIAKEAAWLQSNGWPLYALVDRYSAGAPLDEQANCIAVAVYHEARGETLEGQLAVAKVIMNRAASGKYPSSWCGTVKQPWQFSFVNPHTGQYPAVDEHSASWHKALGVTRLAVANAVQSLPSDCLWYHADYVAPSWGRRLNRVSKIGAHIFYRA
jgi:N-acetylmuramoyl-L-alanine amidase